MTAFRGEMRPTYHTILTKKIEDVLDLWFAKQKWPNQCNQKFYSRFKAVNKLPGSMVLYFFFILIENLANFNFHFLNLHDGWTVKSLLKNDCNCLESKFEYEWRTNWSISLFWRDRIRLLILQSSMQSMKTYTISHDRKSFISLFIVQLNINHKLWFTMGNYQNSTRTGWLVSSNSIKNQRTVAPVKFSNILPVITVWWPVWSHVRFFCSKIWFGHFWLKAWDKFEKFSFIIK